MQHAALAIVLGLVAGLGGGFLATTLMGPAGTSGQGQGGPDTQGRDLEARIQNLEDLMDADRAALKGLTPGTGAASRSADRDAKSLLTAELKDELADELAAKVGESLDERITAKVEEVAAARGLSRRRGGARPRLSLAEAAAEVGLSATEEDALRQIYADHEQRMLKMLAGENGDPEEVRRDLERAVADESVRPELMTKYMPRVVGNLQEVMKIEMTKRSAINQAVGADKARQLERMNIEEADPMGFRGSMRVEASVESDR